MKNQTIKGLTVEELTDKEIKTVKKFHRQLSSPSILEDGLDEQNQDEDSQNITQEEIILMQNVLRAFGFNQESVIIEKETPDTTDGRDYYRLSSSESYSSHYKSSSRTRSRYLSPGRFYVRVSEETKSFVKEVHDKILQINPGLSVHPKITSQSDEKLLNSATFNNLHPNDIDIVSKETLKSPTHGRYNSNIESGSNYGMDNTEFRDSNKSLLSNQMFSNARNGHVGYTNLSRLPPKERFQELARRAVLKKKEENREKKREYERRFWEKRGKVGWLDLIFTSIGLVAFFLDSGTDLKVSSDHFATGHPWWGTFTIILVFFPTVLVNVVSYFFYKEDKDREHGTSPGSGWKAVQITHILQVGLLERYWRILVKAYKIKFKKLRETMHYKLYIAMNLDVAMLQMILAFTEDAPQLVLQLYVLIRRHLLDKLQTSRLQDLWTIASIIFSFISYSRAVVNYITCLRNSKKSKGVLRWYGYIAMWFWRALMFSSRILVLVFFASEFNLWFFIVLFVHFVLVLALMMRQKVNFFPDQRGMQVFIRVVIAYIHTFCFFVLEAPQTIRWAFIYYGLNAVEAIVFSSLWFTNAYREISLELELAGLASIFISYVLGLVMLVVYYKFLHPKFKRPQTKWYIKEPPKEELCEEVENAEGQESEDEEEEASSITGDIEPVRNLDHFTRHRPSNIYVKQFEVWV